MSLALGGGVAALFWLPKLVRDQVAARVEQRTGLETRVSDVSLGLTSVSVGEITASDSEHGPRVHVAEVVLDASPLMLALRGQRALNAVRVGALEVVLPMHEQSTQALLEKLRARTASAANAAAEEQRDAEPAIDVDLRHIVFTVRDDHGELLRLGARASATGGDARLDIDELQLGHAPEHAIELARIGVRAVRGQPGLRLSQVSVGEARISLASRAAAPADDAQGKADGAVADAAQDPEPEVAEADPAAPAAQAAAPRAVDTLARLRRLVNALAPAGSAQANSAPAASGAKPGSAAFSRLTEDAVLALESASVHVGGSKQPPILQNLRATLKVQGQRALSLSGSGKASGGGSVGWDLVLRPEQLQADGEVELRALSLSLIAPFLPDVPWHEPEHGRVDAKLLIKTESAQAIALSGEATLRDAAIAAPRIAAQPVRNIGLSLRGEGRFLPLSHRLEIAEAELSVSEASLQVSGALEWSADHYLFDIDAVLPPTPCTQAVRAVPEDLLGEMALATWQGKLSGKLRLMLDSRDLDSTELDVDVSDRCEFSTVPAMADLRRFQGPFLHSVLEPTGGVFEMETGPGTGNWAYLEDISPFFVHAVLAHEDGGFFRHRGFSMSHVRNALVRNLKEGRYVVGASTITMQLVKNVFLHREKTLARKLQEVLLTWWTERVMEKRDILELYLNVIEYGPGVYGIRNGARHYFNRLPSQLSPAESVYLSTILPNPKRYHVHFERGALSPQWTEIMRRMLVRLRERGSYSPEAVEYGFSELKDFRFVPEGTVVAPRLVPGAAAPLPYMRGFGEDPAWDNPVWDEDLGALPFEFEDGALPTRVDPNAVRSRPAPAAERKAIAP